MLDPLTLSLSKGECALAAARYIRVSALAVAFWVYILRCADGAWHAGISTLRHAQGERVGYVAELPGGVLGEDKSLAGLVAL